MDTDDKSSVGELLQSWGVGHLLNVFEGMNKQ